jgi:SAM-dependent methyltransferase
MDREFAASYVNLETWHWWFCGRRRIFEAILRRELRTKASASIVSLGCGPANGLSWLKPFAGPEGRVVGVDVESVHTYTRPPGIDYILGNMEAVPLADRSFDVVLALDVLEHLDGDVEGLCEAARLMKPGGLLLLTVPAFPSLWGRNDVVCHHRRRYTKRTLYDVFSRAGLPRPSIAYFNALLFAPIAGVRWTRRALGRDELLRSDCEDSRPGVLNDLLTRVFAAERYLIPRWPFPVGVSLMARLRF